MLIEVTEEVAEVEHCKWLVRGYNRAEYHADIYDEVEESLRARGLDAQCLGGGRIRHDPGTKYIKVYGYSMGKEHLHRLSKYTLQANMYFNKGFGKADHTKAVAELEKVYEGYTIEWSDEGY